MMSLFDRPKKETTMHAALLSLALLCGAAGQVQTSDTPETLLYVRSSPTGAEVLLDGKPLGTTDGLFPVKPGECKIVVDLEGHQPEEQTITLRDGRITRIELKLKKHLPVPPTAAPPAKAADGAARRAQLLHADVSGYKLVLDLGSGATLRITAGKNLVEE